MNGRLEWVDDPVKVWMPRYEAWIEAIIAACTQVVQNRRPEIEEWMKQNHVWRNRTRIAEDYLFADVMVDGLYLIVTMGHGALVYYSRFLERYMQGGRFSVLKPALDYWGATLVDDVRKLLA